MRRCDHVACSLCGCARVDNSPCKIRDMAQVDVKYGYIAVLCIWILMLVFFMYFSVLYTLRFIYVLDVNIYYWIIEIILYWFLLNILSWNKGISRFYNFQWLINARLKQLSQIEYSSIKIIYHIFIYILCIIYLLIKIMF